MGVIEGEEEERMEERVEEENSVKEEQEEQGRNSDTSVRFLEDDRLLTALLESTSESRSSGRIRGSFGTVGGRRRRRRELVISDDDDQSYDYWRRWLI